MDEQIPANDRKDVGTNKAASHPISHVELDGEGVLAVSSQINALRDAKDGYLVLGRSAAAHSKWARKGLLEVGAVGEHQTSGDDLFGRYVMVDAAFPHIIFICGKRGSGKSYTLGIFAEELVRSAIGVGVVLIDPIGIFWSLKKENSSKTEREELAKWGLRPQSFPEARILVPSGSRMEKEGVQDGPFTIGVGEMTADDWCQVFDLERFRTQGLMIGTVLEQVQNGYDSVLDGRIMHIEGKGGRYSIDDIVQCIETSLLINSKTGGYSPQTRRSIAARFSAASGWGIFDIYGTPLKDLSSANRITVLDVSDPNLGDSKRSLITGMVARKVLSSRIRTARLEENGTVDESDPDYIPVTWLMIDEAHIILPHGRQTTATEALVEYAKQGRKPGCALILATQRPASTSDEILSQVDILVGHNLALEDDMTAMRRRVPSKLPAEFSNSDFIRAIPVGTAVIADQRTQQRAFLMRVRPRLSHHAGSSAMPKAFMEGGNAVSPLPLSSTWQPDKGMVKGENRTRGGSKSARPESGPSTSGKGPGDGKWSAAPSQMTGPTSKFDLSLELKGRSLLVLESDPNRTLLALEAAGATKGVITFTRIHPDKLSIPPGLGDPVSFWLSSTPGERTIPPTDLQSISMEAQSFLEERSGSLVLLEGADFLLSNNGPAPVRRLLQVLHEKVVLGDHALIVVMGPDTEHEAVDLVSSEVDVVLGREGPAASTEGRAPPDKVGTLTRGELEWMCSVLGLSTEGTDDELLRRMEALRMPDGPKVEPSGSRAPPANVKEAFNGTRKMVGERMAQKDALRSLESKVTLTDSSTDAAPKTMRRKGQRKGRRGRLVLVWDDTKKIAKEGSMEEMEAIIEEIDDIKGRASVPLLKGAVTPPMDPLTKELLERMERDREDDLKRLEGMERAIREALDQMRSRPEKEARPAQQGVARPADRTKEKAPSKEASPKKERVLRALPEAVIVRSAVSETRALETARGDLKRSFLRGPREAVEEVFPVFAPLYRFRVRYKGWLPGTSKEGDILFDAFSGEIAWTGGSGLKRSSGLPRLLSLTEKEASLMVALNRTPKEDSQIASEASLTLRDARRLLTSLIKKGLVKRKALEARTYVYSLPEDLDIPQRPWSSDTGLRTERAEVEERMLEPRFSPTDAERAIRPFLGGARLIDHDTVYYPYYIAKVSGEGRTRFVAVDGRTGRLDSDMSAVVGVALK